MHSFGTYVLITLLTLASLELGCGAAYTMSFGRHVSPWFGGPPLQTLKYKDDYDFDTASIWSNSELPRTEGLYAKETISLPPRGDDYWVFLIGGSTVANVRKPLGQRLSDHIERNLNRLNGKRVRVFNFGVPAFTTFNQLSLLSGKLLAFRPDMVIAYDGVNDAFFGAVTKEGLWRQNFTDVAAGYRQRFVVDINLQQSVRERLVSLLRSVSYTMFYVDEYQNGATIRKLREWDDLTPNEFAARYAERREKACTASVDSAAPYPNMSDQAKARPEAARAFAQNIAAMQAASEAAGVQFVHVLQPTALNKQKLFPCEEFSFRWNGKAYKDFRRELSMQIVLLADAASSVAKKHVNGIYIDLSEATNDSAEYLYDDWHHEFPQGPLLEIVGKLIADDILRHDLSSGPGAR